MALVDLPVRAALQLLPRPRARLVARQATKLLVALALLSKLRGTVKALGIHSGIGSVMGYAGLLLRCARGVPA